MHPFSTNLPLCYFHAQVRLFLNTNRHVSSLHPLLISSWTISEDEYGVSTSKTSTCLAFLPEIRVPIQTFPSLCSSHLEVGCTAAINYGS